MTLSMMMKKMRIAILKIKMRINYNDGEDHDGVRHVDDEADAGGKVVGVPVELGGHFAGKICLNI